mgnify:CR=1 FL=1
MRRQIQLFLMCVVAGCVPVPTPTVSSVTQPPNEAISALAPGEAIAVLDDGQPDSLYVASCVQERLARGLDDVRVLQAAAARDTFFPWLETSRLPVTNRDVEAMLAHATARDRFAQERLRYIFTISLMEQTTGGGAEQGIAGAIFWKLTDHVSARVIALDAGCCRPAGTARATGVQGYAHVVQWGFIVISRVETAACATLGDALIEVLEPARGG